MIGVSAPGLGSDCPLTRKRLTVLLATAPCCQVIMRVSPPSHTSSPTGAVMMPAEEPIVNGASLSSKSAGCAIEVTRIE